MLSFARTNDLDLIRWILVDPKCWRRMVNDAEVPRKDFIVREIPGMVAVIARGDRDQIVGLFLLFAAGPDAEVHFTVLPAAWGQGETIVRAFTEWVWENTSMRALIAPCPSYNRLALRTARRVGFEELDSRPVKATRHGQPFRLIVLQLMRPPL